MENTEKWKWNELASDEVIEKTVESLTLNGITAIVVGTKEDAKKKVLSLIPEKSEVMTMTSVTLDDVGVSDIINKSGKYNATRDKIYLMDRNTQKMEMKKLGSTPEYVVGSIHAITEDGKLIIASKTGSQLPAYAYGAGKVIFVAGAQKIVKNLDEAMKRIYDYVLPLESERANKAYNITEGSGVNKMLIINKEVEKDRIFIIIIKEKIGF